MVAQEDLVRIGGYIEAAALVGVKVSTMYSWVWQERVPFIRLSRRCVKFDLDELEAWIAARKQPPKFGN